MYPFTFKEKEVLALISMGLTTKEIAGKLNISHHTVETHRKNLLRKSEAKNSAQLVQLALASQIIAA
jgi:DNA-binding CsgD family transcriptional regulator